LTHACEVLAMDKATVTVDSSEIKEIFLWSGLKRKHQIYIIPKLEKNNNEHFLELENLQVMFSETNNQKKNQI
jgi:hypothetical protein